MENKLKVLVADDPGTVRDGIKMIVNSQSDMEIVGEAEDGRATVELARELKPNVILMGRYFDAETEWTESLCTAQTNLSQHQNNNSHTSYG